MDSLPKIASDIAACRACPRLVEWREAIALDKRAAFRSEEYWGKGVPGFGDADARVWVMGLAPAAHGANRTGRMFTGDKSGDWLYRAMHKVGFASQAESTGATDGLRLTGAWVSSAVRCAPPDNKPEPAERDQCVSFLVRERSMLTNVKVVVCLGSFAYNAVCKQWSVSPRPKFSHGLEVTSPDGTVILCSYHPSQQNTFTRKLTEPMIDAVFGRARELSD